MKIKQNLTCSLLGIVFAACCNLSFAGENGKNSAIEDTMSGVRPSQLEPFERVTKNIYQAPSRKDLKEFLITDHGAKEGGEVLCTVAIQKTIDAAAAAGGGIVIIPKGTFLSGTIVLTDNIRLHLEKDAVLLGSPWIREYPPQKPATPARYSVWLMRSLIFAQNASNISVTGEGTLNGNSQVENDFKSGERKIKHRPTLIWFDECKNTHIQGVSLTSAGFWTQVYTRCKNLHVDGIRVYDSNFSNNDGCDILDCEDVLVENCDIDSMDDGICLKGYTREGCRNVVIRNNRVRSLCNAIKAGTDSSGGFRNILIENNTIHNTGISGLALEVVDGGEMSNVIIRNITMERVHTPIFIKLGNRNRPLYLPDGSMEKVATGTIRGVHISGIKATVHKCKRFTEKETAHNYRVYASSITGVGKHNVENVTIENVEIVILGGFTECTEKDAARVIPDNGRRYPENRMFGVLPAYGFYVRHVKGLTMKNVNVTIKRKDARPAIVLDDVHDSQLSVTAKGVTDTPTFVKKANCTHVTTVSKPK